LKFKLERLAIPHLTIYLVVISGIVTGITLKTGIQLGVIPGQFDFHELWNLLFFPFQFSSSIVTRVLPPWMALLAQLYMYWIFGSWLEEEMGTVRYNGYMWLGILLVTVGGVLFPGAVDAMFIYLSVFMAIAYVAPDREILLFFFLPMKIKWIALASVGAVLLSTLGTIIVTADVWHILGPVFGLGNFLAFFGREFLAGRIKGRQSARRMEKMKGATQAYFHKCTVCGITDLDDPDMDFRFCVDCVDHEYCMKHLTGHTHQK